MRDTVDQPKTSLVKKAWEACIKRPGLFFLSAKTWKCAFEFLRVTFVFISLVLASILFIAILWRISDGSEVNWIDDWLGTSHLEEKARLETIKTLGQGLGVIIGIYVVYRRARASDKIAQAQQKTAQAQHNANEQKMFNDATAKLSDKSASVRLGGIYALDTLARSNEAYLVRIVKILCAHLRETAKQSKDEEDKKKDGEASEKKYAEQYKDKPSNEIQSLLEVLSELNRFSEEKKGDRQSNPLHLNLSGAYLVGANLESACLNRADLSGTDMRKAHFPQAQLQWAILKNANMKETRLWGAQMQRANLEKAEMQEVRLQEAQMQRADLKNAKMQKARLWKAEMQEARLERARLQEADLGGTQLQEAHLEKAQMQKVSLHKTQMQGAKLQEAQMQGSMLYQTQMQGAGLREAQLQGAKLHQVRMQGATLFRTQLQGAELREVQMQGARLREAQLQGAELHQAEMQGATLIRTQLQGAELREVQLQGATLSEVDLRGAYCQSLFEDLPTDLRTRIEKRQDEQDDLTTVTFKGGLEQEEVQRIQKQLTECQKNGWMKKKKVERIIAILEKHQGKRASHKPPSDIRTGSYDEKEADAIIKKYDKAMANVEEDPLTD